MRLRTLARLEDVHLKGYLRRSSGYFGLKSLSVQIGATSLAISIKLVLHTIVTSTPLFSGSPDTQGRPKHA